MLCQVVKFEGIVPGKSLKSQLIWYFRRCGNPDKYCRADEGKWKQASETVGKAGENLVDR